MQKFKTKDLKHKIAQSFESIAQFCEAAGINPKEFEKELEAGNISADNIIKAAEALNLLTDELCFYFFKPATDPNTEELRAMYEKLTPENKKRFIAKYHELLAEQEAQEKPKYYYFFDCLDGGLSDKYLTAQELAKYIGASEPITEKQIKRIAANYEATLYRYEIDENGNPQNEICIYDPFDM